MTQEYYGTKRITAWPTDKPVEEGGNGYSVKYEDGYISWSPKEVFEKTYQPITAFTFSHALHALKEGRKVIRVTWGDVDAFIGLQMPDENSKMTAPYFYLDQKIGLTRYRVPWQPSHADMLYQDWQIVE